MTRRFGSEAVIQTDATFNTNNLLLPLSVLVMITNTNTTFPVTYCFVASESAETFMFMYDCMRDLFFYDNCPEPAVLLGDFAAGLIASMTKKRQIKSILHQREVKIERAKKCMKTAFEVEMKMSKIESDCKLQCCT